MLFFTESFIGPEFLGFQAQLYEECLKLAKTKILVKKIPKPHMNEDERKKLINFHKDDVKKLENLLGNTFLGKIFKTTNYNQPS